MVLFSAPAKAIALIMLIFIFVCISLPLDVAAQIDNLASSKLYKCSLNKNTCKVAAAPQTG